eukprot:Gb_19700 [translate_table: standard]
MDLPSFSCVKWAQAGRILAMVTEFGLNLARCVWLKMFNASSACPLCTYPAMIAFQDTTFF